MHLFANEPFPAVTGWSDLLTQFGPFLLMPPRRRSVFRNFDDAAQRLQRRVERSVARHGLFSGPQDAASFVAETLMRAENGLDAVEPLTLLAKSCRSTHRATDVYSVVSHH
jgi:hypothetical protein